MPETKEKLSLQAYELFEQLQEPGVDLCIIDVRSEDEHKSAAIQGSYCIPLAELQNKIDQIPKDKRVVIACQSGKRSQQACEILQGKADVFQLEGGMNAWQQANLPVVKQRAASISIQRQVLIAAGLLVAIGSVLALFVNFNFIYLPLSVGLGLTLAGLTGFCGMAILLQKMPWNKEN